jgi:hypothetical protein
VPIAFGVILIFALITGERFIGELGMMLFRFLFLILFFTINNGKAPYFSAGMRVIGEAAISSQSCLDKGEA